MSIYYNCRSIREFVVEDGSYAFKAIDGHLFSADGSTMIMYAPMNTAEEYQIPAGVKVLMGGAFRSSQYLKKVTVPDSVNDIGKAFAYSSLTTIILGNGVTEIVADAFYDCVNLSSITIPNTVTKIGLLPFAGCDSLEYITFNGTVEEWTAITHAWYKYYSTVRCTDGEVDENNKITIY